jgi:HTH-type transcriptional regulator / antitoxin HipB
MLRNLYYYENYYRDFFNTLDNEVKSKFNWTLKLISTIDRVPVKYFRHIEDSTGLYEIRVESGSNIYRVFSFFDKGQLVILINGFQKKSQKTSIKEIEKQKNLKNNILMKKPINNNLTSFEDHLEQQYGKRGTPEREKFEEGFEAFKLGAMIQELRKESGLTQQQLADKCGTTKTYISRIENNASDIRLSTLMRIVREGFGRHLRLSI